MKVLIQDTSLHNIKYSPRIWKLIFQETETLNCVPDRDNKWTLIADTCLYFYKNQKETKISFYPCMYNCEYHIKALTTDIYFHQEQLTYKTNETKAKEKKKIIKNGRSKDKIYAIKTNNFEAYFIRVRNFYF